jgi:hypothetical protein
MSNAALARLHGTFNLASGLWPLLHMGSFETVFGPKADKWLVRTVSGLLVVNGLAQLRARTDTDVESARLIGLGTAGTLALIDLAYAPKGRISRMYLVDAAVELVWIASWLRSAQGAVPGAVQISGEDGLAARPL